MTPTELFDALNSFTKDVYANLGIDYDARRRRNHHGKFRKGKPTGHVLHYTASPNSSVQRLKTLMRRFAINSGRNVGIHFIVFDVLHPEIDDVRAQYPTLFGPNGLFQVDILHYGLELAFWASNWASKYTIGTEMRNVGPLNKGRRNRYYWGRPSRVNNPKYLHKGRAPVPIRDRYWEPFTDSQILTVHRICSNLKAHYGAQFVDSHFLGHLDIHRNKWDPAPHFPFSRLKESLFNGTPFSLDGYLEELADVHCPRIIDTETATAFLQAMGYLPGDFTTAVKLFQEKKNLPRTGQLTTKTMRAMNRTRTAYKLHLRDR